MKFKKGDLVKIPIKSRLGNTAIKDIIEEIGCKNYKYLIVRSTSYEDNVGLCGPGGECIVHNSFHEDDLERYITPEEEFNNRDNQLVNVLNSSLTKRGYSSTTAILIDDLEKIEERDSKFYNVLSEVIQYIASTYDDKYESTEANAFNPKELLTKDVCMFNVSKYLRRYSSTGFEKSGNDNDVLKSIHYLMFTLQDNK